MRVLHPISIKLLARFETLTGKVVPVTDLLDLGPRSAVDQALCRLVRQGKIRRVRRGLYELPRIGKVFNQPVPQSPNEMAQAWARKNGLRLIPSGAYAANLLGLSTQVPAKIIYYTNGRTKKLALGPYTVQLLNRGPKTMNVKGKICPLLFQALRYFGKNGVTSDMISYLNSRLLQKDKTEVNRNICYAPAWMKPILKQIIEGKPS